MIGGDGAKGSNPCCGNGAETVADEAEVTIAERCRCCAVVGAIAVPAGTTDPDASGAIAPPIAPIELAEV